MFITIWKQLRLSTLPISSIIRYFNREEASGQPMQAQQTLIKTLVFIHMLENTIIILNHMELVIILHLQTKIREPS